MPGIWGWATWRDRWHNFQVDFDFDAASFSPKTFTSSAILNYWSEIFRNISLHDTWDYQWAYAIMKNNKYCVRPSLNLVTNIGFGDPDSEHSRGRHTEIEK